MSSEKKKRIRFRIQVSSFVWVLPLAREDAKLIMSRYLTTKGMEINTFERLPYSQHNLGWLEKTEFGHGNQFYFTMRKKGRKRNSKLEHTQVNSYFQNVEKISPENCEGAVFSAEKFLATSTELRNFRDDLEFMIPKKLCKNPKLPSTADSVYKDSHLKIEITPSTTETKIPIPIYALETCPQITEASFKIEDLCPKPPKPFQSINIPQIQEQMINLCQDYSTENKMGISPLSEFWSSQNKIPTPIQEEKISTNISSSKTFLNAPKPHCYSCYPLLQVPWIKSTIIHLDSSDYIGLDFEMSSIEKKKEKYLLSTGIVDINGQTLLQEITKPNMPPGKHLYFSYVHGLNSKTLRETDAEMERKFSKKVRQIGRERAEKEYKKNLRTHQEILPEIKNLIRGKKIIGHTLQSDFTVKNFFFIVF